MNLNPLIERVANFTIGHPDERDCWMKAVAITGILEVGDAVSVAAVERWLSRAIETQRSSGNFSYGDTVQGVGAGHIQSFTPLASLTAGIGYPLLRRYQQTREASYLEAAGRQIEALMNAPRTSEGGIWARGEGPELWVDFTYIMCPFLALYGKLTNEQKYLDEAFKQYRLHVEHLVDPRKHLARHAWCETPDYYPQSTFWSRGNGWLICASVDLLDIAPEHPGAALVKSTCAAALDAIAPYQDASGYFCHVIDNPRSNLEASGTLMFAYATARAVELELVSASMIPQAVKALRAVAGAVEPSGKVPGVAVPPGGPGVPFDWTLFGQGFFLLAASALSAHFTA
ncbi:MAG: glycosyl hydrolase [Rhodocyclaceae bacterium]|nr:MAG: glycosyl hydrolase [Rhodocyclaceae bacterium]